MSGRAFLVRQNLQRLGALGVAERIARSYGLELDTVLGLDRHRTTVRARDEIVSVVHGTFGLSTNELGRVFMVDATSVAAAVKRRAAVILGRAA